MHKAEGLLTVQRPESTLSGKSPLIRLAQEIETRWAATQKQGKKRNETKMNKSDKTKTVGATDICHRRCNQVGFRTQVIRLSREGKVFLFVFLFVP